MEEFPKVYIILVNYNGWQDTIECLESVLKINYPTFQVLVIDNGSTNHSYARLKDWAEGASDPAIQVPERLNMLVQPLIPKPLSFQEYELDSGRFTRNEFQQAAAPSVVFIKAGVNGGFASGNNIGLRFVLSRGDAGFVWLLNNDTLIEKDSLSFLVHYYRDRAGSGEKIGMIGAKLLFYHNPDFLQSLGGLYNPVFGVVRQLGAKGLDRRDDHTTFTGKIDYVVGASIFSPIAFVEEVGLMSEDYFLYFEEIDWAERGKAKGWRQDVCLACRVYHKEGASTGSSDKEGKSFLSDYYALRSRLLFTRKYYPWFTIPVYGGFVPVIINRVLRGQFKRIPALLKLLIKI
jgi:GT2 family glycosyltransferase